MKKTCFGKWGRKMAALLLGVSLPAGLCSGCALAEWELSQLSEYTAPVRGAIEEILPDVVNIGGCDTFISLAGGFSQVRVRDEASALEALQDAGERLGIPGLGENLAFETKDEVLGNTYYRFNQMVYDIPVSEKILVLAVDGEGRALFVSGNYVFADPEEDVITISQGNRNPMPAAERVIASGMDIDGRLQEFYTEYEEESYILKDTARKITVYDAQNSNLRLSIGILDDKGQVYLYDNGKFVDINGNEVTVTETWEGEIYIEDAQGNVTTSKGELTAELWSDHLFKQVDPVINDSTEWENKKAVTLMARVSKIFDFWEEVFGRKGFDHAGGSVYAVYDDYKRVDILFNDSTNASTNAARGYPYAVLSFGTNNSLGFNTIAHEYTHAVERTISLLDSESEPGALAEAYADIFGEIIEDWADDGEFNDSCDWVSDVRNFVDPSKGEDISYPVSYQGEGWWDEEDTSSLNDYGGVHVNSTVISHAAYLMNQGAGQEEDRLSTDEMAGLFYASLFALPSNCTFHEFRRVVEMTAEVFYQQGLLSAGQCRCIAASFDQVGLDASVWLTASPESTITVFDGEGNPCSQVLVWADDGEKQWEAEISGKEERVFDGCGDYLLQVVNPEHTEEKLELRVKVVEKGGVPQIPIFTSFSGSPASFSAGKS